MSEASWVCPKLGSPRNPQIWCSWMIFIFVLKVYLNCHVGGYPISATPIWCFSSCWVCGSKGQAVSVSKTAGSFFEDPKYDPSICGVYPCLKILAYLNSYPNFLVVRVPLFVLGMPCVLAKTCKHHTKPVPKRNVWLVLPKIIPLSNLCSVVRILRFILHTVVFTQLGKKKQPHHFHPPWLVALWLGFPTWCSPHSPAWSPSGPTNIIRGIKKLVDIKILKGASAATAENAGAAGTKPLWRSA